MQQLALEVAVVDNVEIDNADTPDTGSGQIHRRWRTEPARPNAKDTRRLQLSLPIDADFRHDEMTAVPPDFLLREIRRRGGHRVRHLTPPATDGTMLNESPALTGVCSRCR